MIAKDFSNFSEVDNYCRSNYSKEIWENIDILYFTIFKDIYFLSKEQGLKSTLHKKFPLEFLLFRSLKNYLPARVLNPMETSVLVPFPFHRPDLQAFIYPITNILSSRGISNTIIVPRSAVQRGGFLPKLFLGSQILFLEGFEEPLVYYKAKLNYRQLFPEIQKLCQEMQLNKSQSQDTINFFKTFFWDKAYFQKILETTRPSLIYAIHYILHPGYLAAIDEFKDKGFKLHNIAIQHGALANLGYHDFKGVDCVILWGEKFKAILDNFAQVPVPPSKIIGNPKLELGLANQKVRKLQFTGDKKKQKKIILYASTKTSNELLDAGALNIFAGVVSSCPEWNVLYKLHPADNIFNFQILIEQKIIQNRQIIVDKNTSIYTLINQADVVVGTVSTVLVEAIALGKPVIQMLPELCNNDWADNGVEFASNKNDLRERLSCILNNCEYRNIVLQKQQKLAKAIFNKLEGASEEIADYLQGLLKVV